LNQKSAGESEHPLLHIGSGDKALPGWVNIDLKPHAGVDVVADVNKGLDFSEVQAVYAEHFLEHLTIVQAMKFLLESHRVLRKGGWLRLSTPNLDWVWRTHYIIDAPPADKRMMALGTNRAFRGWGHQFLWNPEILEEMLISCGFRRLHWCRYGESKQRIFQGIEQHGDYEDIPEHQHVIIVEAKKGNPQPRRLRDLEKMIKDNFLDHLQW